MKIAFLTFSFWNESVKALLEIIPIFWARHKFRMYVTVTNGGTTATSVPNNVVLRLYIIKGTLSLKKPCIYKHMIIFFGFPGNI